MTGLPGLHVPGQINQLFDRSTSDQRNDIFVNKPSQAHVRLGASFTVSSSASQIFNALEVTLSKDESIDISTSAAAVKEVSCMVCGVERVP